MACLRWPKAFPAGARASDYCCFAEKGAFAGTLALVELDMILSLGG